MSELAIIGATGAVGEALLDALDRFEHRFQTVRLFASERSLGQSRSVLGTQVALEVLSNETRFETPTQAVMCVEADHARHCAEILHSQGVSLVDNSSAFRLDPDVPLVVAGVNTSTIRPDHAVVANPNCSTIIAIRALFPLHEAFGLRRLVAATYQAASGAGAAGLAELEHNLGARMRGDEPRTEVFQRDLASNVIPWIGNECGDDAEEELKLRHEGRKILGLPTLSVSCTSVRVPIARTHSLALTAEFDRDPTLDEAKTVLQNAPGIVFVEGRGAQDVPVPADFSGRGEVGVGRLRRAFDDGPGLALFALGDQLLRGAALNALEIASARLSAST